MIRDSERRREGGGWVKKLGKRGIYALGSSSFQMKDLIFPPKPFFCIFYKEAFCLLFQKKGENGRKEGRVGRKEGREIGRKEGRKQT